jgi:hypothetical protein
VRTRRCGSKIAFCASPPPPPPDLPHLAQVEEYSDLVFDLLDKGAHMYFCGLKGMMPGIQQMLERVAKAKGLNFEEYIEKLKHSGWPRGVRLCAGGLALARTLHTWGPSCSPPASPRRTFPFPSARLADNQWHVEVY